MLNGCRAHYCGVRYAGNLRCSMYTHDHTPEDELLGNATLPDGTLDMTAPGFAPHRYDVHEPHPRTEGVGMHLVGTDPKCSSAECRAGLIPHPTDAGVFVFRTLASA